MIPVPSHPCLVPFDGSFAVKEARTRPPAEAPSKKICASRLHRLVNELDGWQRMLYADERYALLLIFQAMDAAGKDSTIRAVMSGVDPSGCQVFSFKTPTALERAHDFLWRTSLRLPERGKIGIFNRSYYEEVLIVRVHPEWLERDVPRNPVDLKRLWAERYESIRDHEKHLARNGTIILKFWLNVSKAEQKKRLLSRLEQPEKYWKFSEEDLKERKLWNRYMKAYEECLNATSRPWAPWYAVPADNKPYMRTCIAEIIVKTLKGLGLAYPRIGSEQQQRYTHAKKILQGSGRDLRGSGKKNG